MRHVPGPLIAAMSLVLLAACGGDASTSTNGEASLPPQLAAPAADGGLAETVTDGSDFCRAWDELQQADSPAMPLLEALLDAAPSGLEDNVAMYAEIVEEQGNDAGNRLGDELRAGNEALRHHRLVRAELRRQLTPRLESRASGREASVPAPQSGRGIAVPARTRRGNEILRRGGGTRAQSLRAG